MSPGPGGAGYQASQNNHPKSTPLSPVLIFIVNLLLIAEIPQRYPDIDTNTIY
jgi:hypothetical protein